MFTFQIAEDDEDENLRAKDLERVKIEGDGNCFFRAVIVGLRAEGLTECSEVNLEGEMEDVILELRNKMADELRDNKEFYKEDFSDEYLDRHYDGDVEEVRKTTTFNLKVCDCMPLAMARALGIHIIVVQSNNAVPYDTEVASSTTIHLAYNSFGGGHYDATKHATSPSAKRTTEGKASDTTVTNGRKHLVCSESDCKISKKEKVSDKTVSCTTNNCEAWAHTDCAGYPKGGSRAKYICENCTVCIVCKQKAPAVYLRRKPRTPSKIKKYTCKSCKQENRKKKSSTPTCFS